MKSKSISLRFENSKRFELEQIAKSQNLPFATFLRKIILDNYQNYRIKSETFKTVDEIRAERDLRPLPNREKEEKW